MKKIGLLLVIVSVSLMSSCIKSDDITVLDIENFNLKSMSQVELTAKVVSDAGVNVKVLEGNLEAFLGDKRIAKVILAEEVMIPKRDTSDVDINLRMKLDNILVAMQALKGSSEVTVSGEVRVKAGIIKKRYKIEDVSISQFKSQIGNYIKL